MFQNMCRSPKLSLPCRLSEHFTFSIKYMLCWQNILNSLPWRLTSLRYEKKLYEKKSMNTAATLSIYLWRLKCLIFLLFSVCIGFSVTFEHPTSKRYNIYVHCTSSAYFLIDDLLHFAMSVWLHFLHTKILTSCKICTHKMAAEKCFFSQWLCSLVYSSIATSQRQQLHSVCYWIKTFCVGKIWYGDYSSVKWWQYLT